MCKSKTTFLIFVYSVLHIFPVHPINSKKSGVDLKKNCSRYSSVAFHVLCAFVLIDAASLGGGEESRSLFF